MQQPDQNKLDAFLSKMVGDLGSVATGALVVAWCPVCHVLGPLAHASGNGQCTHLGAGREHERKPAALPVSAERDAGG